MTSTLIEVVSLDGIDLESTPPCDALTPFPGKCGKPSGFRALSVCHACQHRSVIFMCAYCHEAIITGQAACAGCWRQRGIEYYC